MRARLLTRREVMRLLELHTVEDVDALIHAKVLIASAYARNGRPLFALTEIRRAIDAAREYAKSHPHLKGATP